MHWTIGSGSASRFPRHGVSARPRGEQEGLEQDVLCRILCNGGTLEAIDGGHANVIKHDFLRVGPRQSVMRLGGEQGRCARVGTSWSPNASDVHTVDVEGHGASLAAAVRLVVGSVCARGAGLHFVNADF